MRRSGLLCLFIVLGPPALARSPGAVRATLEDAVAFYQRARAEQLLVATDANERTDVLVGPAFFEGAEDLEHVFLQGDEAFERAFHQAGGAGQGPPWGPRPLPARVQRLHTGERGGFDASSCRSCHFVGGTDGAGSYPQVGLFGGDGVHLSAARVRDTPHIMGLGYLAALAREIEAQLQREVRGAQLEAQDLNQVIARALRVAGLDFGQITAHPDGTLDRSGVRGVSPDLVLRPFGWKGRHADLVALSDEALQVHLGLQTTSRIETFAHDAETWLGDGPPWDPDGDGVEREANSGQAVLLASYMSMLPVPQLAVPTDPVLAFAWARGRAHFDDVGCADCHRPELRVRDLQTTLTAQGEAPFSFSFDLAEAGQAPAPRWVDHGEGPEGEVVGGVPLYAFTDLQRHDLGPELAGADEALPDGGGVVPGSVWLTRPLWGLADTAPYLHDGRAPTVHAAIEWHGGEAAASRDAYRALTPEQQGALRMFLLSMSRNPTLLVE
jgi:hypothetical protein